MEKRDYIERGVMAQYVVYRDLTQWPGQYVVRAWNVSGDGPMLFTTLPRIVTADLAQARASIPNGYVNVGRHKSDAKCIVEIWV